MGRSKESLLDLTPCCKGAWREHEKCYLELLSDGSRRSTRSASPHTRLTRFVLNPPRAPSAPYSDSTRRRSLAP